MKILYSGLIIFILSLACVCHAQITKGLDALDFEYDSIDQIEDLEKAVGFYEDLGGKLNAFLVDAQSLYESGLVPENVCLNLKSHYNKLRLAYIKAGDLIIMGIVDPKKRCKNIVEYRAKRDFIVCELGKLNKKLTLLKRGVN